MNYRIKNILLTLLFLSFAFLCTGKAKKTEIVQEVGERKNTSIADRDARFWNRHFLFTAVVNGDVDRVKQLIRVDPNLVNATYGQYNWTPLHKAAKKGHLAVVKFLIEKGAKLEVRDTYGRTPLLLASKIDTAKLLVGSGADFKAISNSGFSVLHEAAYKGNIELAKLWIKKGVDIEQQYKNGGTALLCAARRVKKQMVELLLKEGASINSRDSNGETALHKAAAGCDMAAARAGGIENSGEAAEFLLEKGMEVDSRDNTGETPLHKVSQISNSRRINSAKALIGKGADVNAKNKKGLTPLYFASQHTNTKLIKLLLEKGADVNVRDEENRTPLYLSVRGHWSQKKGGNIHDVKLLLQAGAKVNVKLTRGGTPLHAAVSKGRIDLTKLLLAHGADVNAASNPDWRFRRVPPYRRTPLHIAASVFALEQREQMYEERIMKAELSEAYQAARFAIVKLLLENGAEVNVKDSEGKTPLDYAEDRGYKDITTTLRKHGAKCGTGQGKIESGNNRW